jgi:hypothetical protein
LGYGRAVSSVQPNPIDLDLALGRNQIAATVGAQRIVGAVAGVQGRRHDPRIGANGQGAPAALGRVAFKARGQDHELTRPLALGKGLRAPAGGLAAPGRLDPDLEYPGQFRLGVVFGVTNAGAGAHDLNIAGDGAALVAQAVLMGDGPVADIGDDLHVRVRVRREAGPGGDLIVIPNPQIAPAHPLGIIVVGEGEVMFGVQPAMVGAAERFKGSAFDHRSVLRPGRPGVIDLTPR